MNGQTIFKKTRKERHQTQLELALQMGVTRGTLVNLEDGTTHVLTESVLKFCDATGLQLLDVVAACYPEYCPAELREDVNYKEKLRQTVDEYEKRLEEKNAEIAHQKELIESLRQTNRLQEQMIGMMERQASGNPIENA